MTPIVRAIDVGRQNTKYVLAATDERIECALFPSLAFHSTSDPTVDLLGGKRKTVAIPVDGVYYEVGPDVELAADRFRMRLLQDNYMDTREYSALWRGALAFMKVDVVDVLVVGLPVAQFRAKKSAVEEAMTGEFDVGRRRKVVVRKTLVVAQPQGALYHHAAVQGRMREVLEERSLVIDPGSRTFDWLVTRGMGVVSKLSHSVNRGVFDILREIATHISSDLQTDYRDLDAIDLALRTGKNLKIFGKPYDLKRFDATVREIAEQAVRMMMQHIDDTHAFDNIVLVGGGAHLFKRAVRNAFPRHTIIEVKEPVFANVRGFQLAGQKVAAAQAATPKALPAAPTPPTEGAPLEAAK